MAIDELIKTALRVKSERDSLVNSICRLADTYAQAGETVPAYKSFVSELRKILVDAGITIPRFNGQAS